MKNKSKISFLVAAVCCLGFVFALTGCMGAAEETVDEQALNREYMSQVNIIMDDLDATLTDFTEAVSNNDIVGMKSRSEAVSKAIDTLEKLEAPEALKEVHSDYVSGCQDLKAAFDDYIDLYAEVDAAEEDGTLDDAARKSYDDDIEKINKKYQSGIDHLESADKKASEME